MKGSLHQALVVARRDFAAIVMTPTFFLFLLAPLMIMAFSMVGGMGAAAVAKNNGDKERIVVIAPEKDIQQYRDVDARLRDLMPTLSRPVPIEYLIPRTEITKQAMAALNDKNHETHAILFHHGGQPVILQANPKSRNGFYLVQLENARQQQLTVPDIRVIKKPMQPSASRKLLASAAVVILFMLTLILASQAVGMLAEEKSNKVIEILAAAAPLESVFFGKLIGMLGVALLFASFWALILGGGAILGISQLQDPVMAQTLSATTPAVGWFAFALLFLIYFVLAFLLLGAMFLGIGAQAATMREIQMLSLPLTILQIAMFGIASAAAAAPGTTVAHIAEIIPFSSPLAMAARAANEASLWPHLLAIVWQIIWVGLTIAISVRLFRAGVLKSGSGVTLRLRRAISSREFSDDADVTGKAN